MEFSAGEEDEEEDFFLKIVAGFFPTRLQISFPLFSDRPWFKGVSSVTLPEREADVHSCLLRPLG